MGRMWGVREESRTAPRIGTKKTQLPFNEMQKLRDCFEGGGEAEAGCEERTAMYIYIMASKNGTVSQ
jgi:hypothetical protein